MDKIRFTVRGKWLGQPATAVGVVPATAGLAIPDANLYLNRVEIHSRGVATNDIALVALLKDAVWGAGQWVDATTTYTDDTVGAQSAATNDFPLETATGANDGHIISALVKFGAVSYDITTAQAAASAVHIVEYWNGTAYVAIAAVGMLVDIPRSVVWPAGEFLMLFDPPSDWAKGGSGTGVPQDRFNLRVRGTPTTGTQAGLARRIYVGQVFHSVLNIAQDAASERSYPTPLYLPSSFFAALGAAFGTANEGNLVDLECTYGTAF